MGKRALVRLGWAGLLLGTVGAVAGTAIVPAAVAGSQSDTRAAAKDARKAEEALLAGRWTRAVRLAERAVAADPNNAGHRGLLGRAYMRAGRFVSADAAFGDALALAPTDGRVALHLSLAQIAAGRWDAARTTLAAHAETIPAVDRGLALALAGDAPSAVTVLTEAARAPDATATTRQNLALSMALAGRWPEARSVAAIDMTPAQVDERIGVWASFATPRGASDQVAALLNVTPAAEDAGQPVALALRREAAPVALAAVEPAPAPVRPRLVFGPRKEVVQALPAADLLPAPLISPGPGGYKTHATRVTQVVRGKRPVRVAAVRGSLLVRPGGYARTALVQRDWAAASRQMRELSQAKPAGVEALAFYRVATGTLGRDEATALCRSYRQSGGDCFVRGDANASPAVWATPLRRVEVAAR